MKIIIQFFVLIFVLTSCQNKTTNIQIETSQGDIIIELYPENAPITVANFITYIKQYRFKDATFYRAVTPNNQPDNNVTI